MSQFAFLQHEWAAVSEAAGKAATAYADPQNFTRMDWSKPLSGHSYGLQW